MATLAEIIEKECIKERHIFLCQRDIWCRHCSGARSNQI